MHLKEPFLPKKKNSKCGVGPLSGIGETVLVEVLTQFAASCDTCMLPAHQRILSPVLLLIILGVGQYP